MKLDPRRLEIFHAVVQGGSMSEAARELRFSPAAVSQHVTALERQVGTPLLVRHARGVRPTATGEVLARHAAALVAELADAERELDDLLASAGGTVRVGLFASATVGILPAAVHRFAAAQPGVRVAAEEHDADVSADLLRTGALDVAIVLDDHEDPALDTAGLTLTPLGRDPMDVALSAQHAQAASAPIPLAALRDERWILPRGAACLALVLRTCRVAGFVPTVELTTDDHAAARGMAAAGLGVAVLPRLLGQRTGDGVVVTALDPAPARTLSVALPATQPTPAAVALRDAFVASSPLVH